ncbi:MAG: hypothetical protein M3O91_06870 [Chloroflexota bacterium]|nr:hypothetical protein [Chloroflexota bacterium]
MDDLEDDELAIDRLFAAVPPEAPPLGFRDAVMRALIAEERTSWEWIVAALLALPSFTFVAWELARSGADFARAFESAIAFATSAQGDAEAFFFVDGLFVLAVALLGLASLIATHALLRRAPRVAAAR